MNRPRNGLADTSIFVARESGRPLAQLPEQIAISVVTIGELKLGVLNAKSADLRARRGETLALARAADPLPITEAVMASWANLVADCRRADIHRTVRLTDALIAATAVEHGFTVFSQDRDYAAMSEVHEPLAVELV